MSSSLPEIYFLILNIIYEILDIIKVFEAAVWVLHNLKYILKYWILHDILDIKVF